MLQKSSTFQSPNDDFMEYGVRRTLILDIDIDLLARGRLVEKRNN